MVGAATAKLREPKHVGGHMGQPTNYSLMNEVYEMERTVPTCGSFNVNLYVNVDVKSEHLTRHHLSALHVALRQHGI